MFAIAWLNNVLSLGNFLKDIGRRIAGMPNAVALQFVALVHRAKLSIHRRTEEAPSGGEMQTKRRGDADDLKRLLIA